jgi:Putative prokaryotic signal transducing protein
MHEYGEAVTPVTLTVVPNELEAEVICGALRANGIACNYRKTDMAAGWTMGTTAGGPIKVLVDESDLAAAQQLVETD